MINGKSKYMAGVLVAFVLTIIAATITFKMLDVLMVNLLFVPIIPCAIALLLGLAIKE